MIVKHGVTYRKLRALVEKWRGEQEFLVNNSIGSDILIGNTYGECADELESLYTEEVPDIEVFKEADR